MTFSVCKLERADDWFHKPKGSTLLDRIFFLPRKRNDFCICNCIVRRRLINLGILVKGKDMNIQSKVNHILLTTDTSRGMKEDAAKAISHFEMNDKLKYVMTTFNQSFKV